MEPITKISLPVDSYISLIQNRIKQVSNLIITADPGTGKTTRIPPALLSSTEEKVLVLVPRRIAATSAAARIATENNWLLGEQVGYHVRFDRKFNNNTRLIFVTEAMLINYLRNDSDLKGISCVILDEFHERHVSTDVGVSLLYELQMLTRPDLKIIIMSATLDTSALKKYLVNCEHLHIEAKHHPVEIIYDKKSLLLRCNHLWFERMENIIRQATNQSVEGDILVFCPGVKEIENLKKNLIEKKFLDHYDIFLLHGGLGIQEQQSILANQSHRPAIILSTNVAESSLTLPRVKTVVDSGLVRQANWRPQTGFSSLETQIISKASGTQRAGRSARLGPGKVFRAWTRHDEMGMSEFEVPEVSRVDLVELIFDLCCLGIKNPEAFSWYQIPPQTHILLAIQFLVDFKIIQKDNYDNLHLTKLGEEIQQFAIHPRIAILLRNALEASQPELGAKIAALLSDGLRHKNTLIESISLWPPNDRIQLNYKKILGAISKQKTNLTFKQMNARHSNSHNILDKKISEGDSLCIETQISEIVFSAFHDRLCRRRRMDSENSDLSAKMCDGQGVSLPFNSPSKNSEYFLAIDLRYDEQQKQAIVSLSLDLDTVWLLNKIQDTCTKQSQIEWNQKSEKFQIVSGLYYNKILIGQEERRPLTSEDVDKNIASIANELFHIFKDDLQKNPSRYKNYFELFDRLAYFYFFKHKKQFTMSQEEPFPFLKSQDYTDIFLDICMRCLNLDKLAEFDFSKFVLNSQSIISFSHELMKACPTKWLAPSNREYQINYSHEQGAFVEIRLQEVFGLQANPIIGDQKLTLVLLGPNYRPVQVTRDIRNFWLTTYNEVRKELRTRYPKHSWPEDPLIAPAVAKGKSTKS